MEKFLKQRCCIVYKNETNRYYSVEAVEKGSILLFLEESGVFRNIEHTFFCV